MQIDYCLWDPQEVSGASQKKPEMILCVAWGSTSLTVTNEPFFILVWTQQDKVGEVHVPQANGYTEEEHSQKYF